MDDFPKEYDIIVVGTGFTECLVAAAAARVGKKVLHLDKNEYYGGPWASFSLHAIQEWISNLNHEKDSSKVFENKDVVKEGEILKQTSNPDRMFSNLCQSWHIPEEILTSPPTKKICSENILKEDTQVDEKDDDDGEAKSPTDNNDGTQESEVSQSMDASSDANEDITSDKASSGDDDSSVNVAEQKVSTQQCSQKDLLSQTRKFNLDLTTKLLYARGLLVELLISSNVARYMEFKGTTRILTWMEDSHSLVSVPCSRSDVFKTDSLSLIEKRLLMKFLEICYKYEDHKSQWEEYEQQPFINFLKSHKLTPKLIHYITAAIAMVPHNIPCITGLQRMQLFLTSLGRYGPSPFLFSMYGCGEIPQAFCRLCAVFEGIYVLRRGVEDIVLNTEGEVTAVVSEGERLSCRQLVMQAAAVPQEYTKKDTSNSVSRGIFITDSSILSSENDQLTLLRFPQDDKVKSAITVLEVNSTTGVCPKDLYVVSMTCEGEDAKHDLAVAVDRLFLSPDTGEDDSHSPILWSLYFNQINYTDAKENKLPDNLHFCSGPDAKLDYDDSITQAKELFLKIYPEEEFLPRAPDPEEIVFESETSDAAKEETFTAEDEEGVLSSKEDDADKMKETAEEREDDSLQRVIDKNLEEPMECSNTTSVVE